MNIRIVFSAIILSVITFQSCGQEGPGSVYSRINEAYESRNMSLLMSAYQDGAFYLGPDGRIMNDREAFLAPIQQLFDDADSKGQILAMNFRVIKREYLNDAAMDIGYFKLDWLSEKGIESSEAGKFMALSRKQTDGSWKFQAVSFSDSSVEAFLGR